MYLHVHFTCLIKAFLIFSLVHFVTSVGLKNEILNRRALSKPDRPKFLLILLDGFAASYLDKPDLVGFNYIKHNGVHAAYMVPQFPTLTYPNLYSILTGRYVENHQIIMNAVYELPSNQTTDKLPPKWWDKVETIWISTTRAGLRTRVYLWPGCQIAVNGTRVEFCEQYSLNIWTNKFQLHLREVVEAFDNDSADVGFVYCEQPDFFGHIFGPNSTIIDATVRSLDRIIMGYLEDIIKRKLLKKINFIVVSDHGMTSVGRKVATKIPLGDYINLDEVENILDRGVAACIYPIAGKLESVYQRLKQMPGVSVWKPEEIPENYHIKLAASVPPIYILAHKGYYIKGVPRTPKQLPRIPVIGIEIVDNIMQGFHGYDAEEITDMRGIFLAMGPDFKENFTLGPIFNKDVYNLAMHVIDLPPIANDGNWTDVLPALKTSASSAMPMIPATTVAPVGLNPEVATINYVTSILAWESICISFIAILGLSVIVYNVLKLKEINEKV